uniref:Late embryogenesis abundant protein n=1 Tax=Picea glauca TaxID=3330 RepID=Q40862_PICGL|nr:late embryogenesis abundant protein [Picea glauca]
MAANKLMNVVAVAVCVMVMVNAASAVGKAKCTDKWYPRCYGYQYDCPANCPYNCDMDCKTCKTVCPCDKPGGVCQDPRFIGGDGIMFYFHGKRDQDFCLISDSNLHINAHFIGKRGQGMGRDFTWVQSIGVLLEDGRQFYLGAKKVSTWDNSVDQLTMALNGQTLTLPPGEGATWATASGLNVTRSDRANEVVVQVEDKLKISARVVPISEEESRVHNYGIIAGEDCFAHLELSFKFYSLSPNVSGVLGQTYGAEYRSPVKMGVAMPIMGGESNYVTSNLFAADCKVARFASSSDDEYAITSALDCNSGRGSGHGIVSRR